MKKKPTHAVVSFIEAERKRQGLTIKQMTEKAGVFKNTYYNWLYQGINPTIAAADKVLAALGVTYELGVRKENTMDVKEIKRTGAAQYDIPRLADKLEKKLYDAYASTGPGYGFDGYWLKVAFFTTASPAEQDILSETLENWEIGGSLYCDQLIVQLYYRDLITRPTKYKRDTTVKAVYQEAYLENFTGELGNEANIVDDFEILPGGKDGEYSLRMCAHSIECLPFIFAFIRNVKEKHDLDCFLVTVNFDVLHS